LPVINKIRRFVDITKLKEYFKFLEEWDKDLGRRIVSGEVQSNILEIMGEYHASNIKQADED
jgi:hypothetical protein